MMKTISMKAGLAAALAASTLFVTPAIAAEAEGATVAVRYSDLNLATPEGQAALERRLENAARQVCQIDDIRVGTRIPSREAQRCYDETLEALSRQVATLTAQDRSAG